MVSGFKNKILTCFILPLLLIAPLSPKSNAMELGFTPGHVHGLWQRINQVLLKYSHLMSEDELWLQQVNHISLKPVSGKVPADVIAKVEVFGQLLTLTFPRIEINKQLISEGLQLHQQDNVSEVRPTQVYLLSSQLLFAMVEETLAFTEHEILIGHFLKPPAFESKTPNDVYAQVILASQRLQVISQRQQKQVKR